MRALVMTAVLALGGCSQILGIDTFELPDGGSNPDGKPDGQVDAPKEDAPSGPRLTGKIVNVRGSSLAITNDPGENVIWADLASGDPFDSTTTNADGDFEVSLANGNMGQLKVGPDLVYAVPGHVTSDAYVLAGIYDQAAFNHVLSLYSETSVPGDANFFVIVEDENRQPVEGAMVTMDPNMSTPAYADADNLPEMGRTMTSTSGVIWFFNTPANTTYTFSASKGGTVYTTYAIQPAENALVYAPLLPSP